jgi:hypothetical protein
LSFTASAPAPAAWRYSPRSAAPPFVSNLAADRRPGCRVGGLFYFGSQLAFTGRTVVFASQSTTVPVHRSSRTIPGPTISQRNTIRIAAAMSAAPMMIANRMLMFRLETAMSLYWGARSSWSSVPRMNTATRWAIQSDGPIPRQTRAAGSGGQNLDFSASRRSGYRSCCRSCNTAAAATVSLCSDSQARDGRTDSWVSLSRMEIPAENQAPAP